MSHKNDWEIRCIRELTENEIMTIDFAVVDQLGPDKAVYFYYIDGDVRVIRVAPGSILQIEESIDPNDCIILELYRDGETESYVYVKH